MKWLKRTLAICSFCTLLTVTKCFAVTDPNIILSNDGSFLTKTYQVLEKDSINFIDNLEKELEVDGVKYNFTNYTSEGGNTTDTIQINTSKTITSKTNNIQSIIEQLGEVINYNEDGYVGEYVLDTQNINVKTNYNGFREDLIEKTINYTNLERNDLDFIPKQTIKNGFTLDLLNVEWKVENTQMIGNYEVANTYTAKCYYAGKQRINYPNTYTVTANYSGTATKTTENPITYNVKYKKVELPIQEVEEEKQNNIIPITTGTTGIILIICFFLTRNITVYNFKDGVYKKVGKTRLKTNNTVSLNRFIILESTNKYKLEFSKALTNKIKGKMITIKKNNSNIKMLVNSDNEKYNVEFRL